MARGGARASSGPAHDPKSARSEARGLTTTAVLPAVGYTGRIPGLNQHLPRPRARHRVLWEKFWRYPHATVWIREPWRYPLVAELVRLMVLTEQDECPVGVWTAIRQHREDLGLSTAGRRQEGWEVASGVAYTAPAGEAKPPATGDELGERRQRRSQTLHEE